MGGRETLVIRGDFNHRMGREEDKRGICGRYRLGEKIKLGRDLLEVV